MVIGNSVMKFFGYFRSSAAFRLRIAMNLKGLDYEFTLVNLQAGDQDGEEFKEVNPQGRVPALIVGTETLIQSLAIMEYLEETYPDPPLLPSDSLGKAKVRAICGVIACDIHPLNNLAVLNYLRDKIDLSEADREKWYRHWVKEGFDALETMLSRSKEKGKFCFGDRPTLADVCLVPQIVNAQRFNCPLDCYPILSEIFEACMDIKEFSDAHPTEQKEASYLS
jgi:maleylpyruvate isomerase